MTLDEDKQILSESIPFSEAHLGTWQLEEALGIEANIPRFVRIEREGSSSNPPAHLTCAQRYVPIANLSPEFREELKLKDREAELRDELRD